MSTHLDHDEREMRGIQSLRWIIYAMRDSLCISEVFDAGKTRACFTTRFETVRLHFCDTGDMNGVWSNTDAKVSLFKILTTHGHLPWFTSQKHEIRKLLSAAEIILLKRISETFEEVMKYRWRNCEISDMRAVCPLHSSWETKIRDKTSDLWPVFCAHYKVTSAAQPHENWLCPPTLVYHEWNRPNIQRSPYVFKGLIFFFKQLHERING